jgi:ADP-ribose pyrophosphatase YjhB (NUDIX family)
VRALLSPVAFGVSALARNRSGDVLLVRHGYKAGWTLPGGGVDRGEPASEAILREMREEVGLLRASAPEFVSLYTRKAGWATNVIALYRLNDIEIAFKRSMEIREAIFVNPECLPTDTAAGTRRRISEVIGGLPTSLYW